MELNRFRHEAVKEGVGHGWAAYTVMPMSYGELTGDQSCPFLTPVVQDFQKVDVALFIKVAQPPIVQDEKVDFGHTLEISDEAAVRPSDGELLRDTTYSMVQCGMALATGLVGESAGEPAFTYPGGTGNDDVTARFDPAASEQVLDHLAVQASRGAVVYVLGTSRLSEFCRLQPCCASFLLACLPF